MVGIGGARSVGFGKDKVRSLPDAVAKVLSMHYGFSINGRVEDKKIIANRQSVSNGFNSDGFNGHNVLSVKRNDKADEKKTDVVRMQQLALSGEASGVFVEESGTSLYDLCPECGGGSLAYEEGCRKCYSCGYSEC